MLSGEATRSDGLRKWPMVSNTEEKVAANQVSNEQRGKLREEMEVAIAKEQGPGKRITRAFLRGVGWMGKEVIQYYRYNFFQCKLEIMIARGCWFLALQIPNQKCASVSCF